MGGLVGYDFISIARGQGESRLQPPNANLRTLGSANQRRRLSVLQLVTEVPTDSAWRQSNARSSRGLTKVNPSGSTLVTPYPSFVAYSAFHFKYFRSSSGRTVLPHGASVLSFRACLSVIAILSSQIGKKPKLVLALQRAALSVKSQILIRRMSDLFVAIILVPMTDTSSEEDFNVLSDDEQCALQSAVSVLEILRDTSTSYSFHCGRLPASVTVQRGQCRWYSDYLCADPVYSASKFRQIFRIPLKLYWILYHDLIAIEPSLLQQTNAANTAGHTPHQKILGTLRRLATALSFQQMDDMVRMSPESQRRYFLVVLNAIYRRYGAVYLNREPSLDELRKIEAEYAKEGFPGCIGCVDCMHIHWKNCPKSLKGQYHNPKDGKLATLSCEALCDRRLYCWHWFPGRCGTNNDITVVDNSPLFIDILSGNRRIRLPEGFTINGETRNGLLYFLVDGIYPRWAIFVGPNHAAVNEREINMTGRQESTRKDIERLFGALQGRFKVLRDERCEWSDEMIILISQVCIILHNMLVDMDYKGELQDEVGESGESISVVEEFTDENTETSSIGPSSNINQSPMSTLHALEGLQGLLALEDLVTNEETHRSLTDALSHHLWSMRGDHS